MLRSFWRILHKKVQICLKNIFILGVTLPQILSITQSRFTRTQNTNELETMSLQVNIVFKNSHKNKTSC